MTERVRLAEGAAFVPGPETCQLWVCIEGEGLIGGERVRAGEVWLLPETGDMPAVSGEAEFLRTWAPK